MRRGKPCTHFASLPASITHYKYASPHTHHPRYVRPRRPATRGDLAEVAGHEAQRVIQIETSRWTRAALKDRRRTKCAHINPSKEGRRSAPWWRSSAPPTRSRREGRVRLRTGLRGGHGPRRNGTPEWRQVV
jgi:hypothetical protein